MNKLHRKHCGITCSYYTQQIGPSIGSISGLCCIQFSFCDSFWVNLGRIQFSPMLYLFGSGPIHVCAISIHFEYKSSFELCQCQRQIWSIRVQVGIRLFGFPCFGCQVRYESGSQGQVIQVRVSFAMSSSQLKSHKHQLFRKHNRMNHQKLVLLTNI